MPGQIYNWKRFWCPRTGHIDLSDGGYVSDPESQYGYRQNPDTVPFASIAHMPCLALLGEPGIGKSRAMAMERDTIEATIRKQGDQTLWLDLRSFGSEDRLVQNLFGSPPFASWIQGEHRLHILGSSQAPTY